MAFQPIQSVSPEELIDFEDQLRLFGRMLTHSARKRLMFIQAPGMCGKTSFLRMVCFHCEQKSIPWCWIDFRGQSYDNPHFTLAYEVCDQLGPSPCCMAQALRPLSSRGPVEAKSVTSIGGNVTNSHIVTQTQILTEVSLTHNDLSQRHMKDRLKRAFVDDLGGFAAKRGRVVCLFDSFEDISAEEEDWLLDALLRPVARGELEGVTVVTAGRRWPKIEGWDWEMYAYLINGLPAMSVEHIKIYAKRVGVEITDEQAVFCWWACRGGNPLFMAVIIKNLRAVGKVRRRLERITAEIDEEKALGLLLDEVIDQVEEWGVRP